MTEGRGIDARRRSEPRALSALLVPIAGILMFVALAAPAWAHREGPGREAPENAIIIPNLSHGQMAVIANNRAAILDLAAQQMPTDPTMRRLEAFINLQFFDCLWGMAPGSVEDENSPFNECSHAYLAATRALLLHLQSMPGDRTAVRALVAKIENEMLENNSSLVMCRYSDESFNTAERIQPHWAEIPFHLPTLMTFAGLALLTTGCAGLGIRQMRRPSAAFQAATAPPR